MQLSLIFKDYWGFCFVDIPCSFRQPGLMTGQVHFRASASTVQATLNVLLLWACVRTCQ